MAKRAGYDNEALRIQVSKDHREETIIEQNNNNTNRKRKAGKPHKQEEKDSRR